MQTSHADPKNPNSQQAILVHYQNAPNAAVSQAEETYLRLLEAINQGNESDVKEILSTNATLLATYVRGSKAGCLAAGKGHLNIVKMIIEAGVKSLDINPWLDDALRNGHLTTASFLVMSGARVNNLQRMSTLKETLLATNCNRATAGDLAASSGDLGLMQIVVAAGVDVNINTSDPWLHQALRNQHFTTAKFLIKSGADIDAKSSQNQTAFGAAVSRGCETSISLLHESGAEIRPGRRLRLRSFQQTSHPDLQSLKIWCKTGKLSDGDKSSSWTDYNISMPFVDQFLDPYIIEPEYSPMGELLLDFEDESTRLVNSEDLPTVEILMSGPRASMDEIPRSCEEPVTTILSTIKSDNEWIIQLLLEERTNLGGRYLWERVIWQDSVGFLLDGQPSGNITRFIREWGPIATMVS